MKILNLYIGRLFTLTFLLSVGVITFVMLTANLVQAFQLLARGIPLAVMLKLLLNLLPFILKYAIPMGVLCSSVLVFSRLSADGEITAMRASGVGLWQIITPGLLVSILLSGVCFYIQTELAPHCKYRVDQLKQQEAASNPLAFLEPGDFVEMPGYFIYVGKRDGNLLEEVRIYRMDDAGKMIQDISAKRGSVAVDEVAGVLELTLQEALIVTVDPESPGKESRLSSQTLVYPLSFRDKLNTKPLMRKTKHMDLEAIFACLSLFEERGAQATSLYVELHTRLSLSLAPFAFLLLGIPFGIRTRRSETSVGLVISLAMALFFYVFLILADGLKHQPQYHPEILVWLPNILYQIGGILGLMRIAKS
jgi:lipopolysaccharide export system permease protein